MAHDTNGSIVRLDYKELLLAVSLGIRYAKIEVERQRGEIYTALEQAAHEHPMSTSTMVKIELSGERHAEAAAHLETLLKSFTYLRAMETRSEVSWRNHPHPDHPHVDGCMCDDCRERM